MGSGLAIMRAIEKHRKDKFKKEIISFYETSDDAYKAEEILITEEMILSNEYYNLVPVGKRVGTVRHHLMFNKISVKNEFDKIKVLSKEEFEAGNYTNRTGKPVSKLAKTKLKQNSYFKGHVIIKTDDGKYDRVTTEEYKSGKYVCISHGKVFSEESRKKN
jgi:hypothetical protein